jgi:hypothetical protein
MGKMIIKNESSVTDHVVLSCVQDVILGGRISDEGNCYCFATSYAHQQVVVFCYRTKSGTDVFIVRDIGE